MSQERECSVEPADRAKFEKQLLVALEDGDKAAMILGKDDVAELIRALDYCKSKSHSARTASMLRDLKQLYKVTFGGDP